jgi:hypothetical protein
MGKFPKLRFLFHFSKERVLILKKLKLLLVIDTNLKLKPTVFAQAYVFVFI